MKLVLVSNFYNHHQASLSFELFKMTSGNFYFVETEEMTQERKKMGWEIEQKPQFVISYNSSCEYAIRLIDEADAVIIGNAPISIISNREKHGKISFVYSERIFKGQEDIKSLLVNIKRYYIPYHKNLFCLCASAFAYADFQKLGLFKNRAFKWGYFPKTIEYTNLHDRRNKENNEILWVSRFIDWKHPEFPVKLAIDLNKSGYNYKITMIGTGVLEEKYKNIIIDKQLDKNIEIIGGLRPEEVRNYMEKSNIYILTSDKGEGWGAVLNEAMNSGCAVVASSCCGSTPYLIEDGYNGLIFASNNYCDFYNKVTYLLNNSQNALDLGTKAYTTVLEKWNAKVAAARLIDLIIRMKSGRDIEYYCSGPCSKAESIADDWYLTGV